MWQLARAMAKRRRPPDSPAGEREEGVREDCVAQQATYDQLYRSRDAYVGGVCAGIAEHLDFDPIVIRILAILLTVVTLGLGGVVYLLLWALIPRRPELSATYDIIPERAESIAHGHLDYPASGDDEEDVVGERSNLSITARLAIAVGLMVLFLMVAMNVSPIVSGTRWWQFWPIAFLIAGLCLLVIPVPTRFGSAWHAAGIVVMSLGAAMLPMSLGVISWATFPNALLRAWILLVVAVALLVIGLINRVNALVYAAAFCAAAFLLVALLVYAVPGDVETLLLYMPDGRSLRLVLKI